MNNIHTSDLRGKRSMKIFFSLLCLCSLAMACGESSESQEVIPIDNSYLESSKITYPPVVYPIEILEVLEMEVGKLFGYPNIDWGAIFPSDFGISTPEILEGEGTICMLADDNFSVVGKSSGSCSLKYPSTNAGTEGFIYLTINFTEG